MSETHGKGLSSDLVAFIGRHFHSIRQLEALLWVHSHPETAWTAEELARALRCNEWSTSQWLKGFEAVGLVVEEAAGTGRYRYSSSSKEVEDLILRLASEYKVRPLRVIDVIVSRPTRKMMDLMNAFKFNPGDNGDDG